MRTYLASVHDRGPHTACSYKSIKDGSRLLKIRAAYLKPARSEFRSDFGTIDVPGPPRASMNGLTNAHPNVRFWRTALPLQE